jgi:uncharacterized integral membrane protein
MKNVKRFLLLSIVILIGIFAFRNQAYLTKQVDLVFIRQAVSMMLGFWLVLCFLVGVLMYMIFDVPRDIILKRDLRRKAQEIARLQFELTRLQNAAAGSGQPPPYPQNPDLEKRLGL